VYPSSDFLVSVNPPSFPSLFAGVAAGFSLLVVGVVLLLAPDMVAASGIPGGKELGVVDETRDLGSTRKVVAALSAGRKAAVVAAILRAMPTLPLGLVAELLFLFCILFQP
jgi:hypothetical protein